VGLEAERDTDTDATEEERRLFYVGVTRGQERVFLTRVRYRMRFGKTDFAMPSPFLSEIPDEHLEVDNRTSESGDERWDADRFGFSMGDDRDAFAAYLSGGRRRRRSPRRGRTIYFRDFDETVETPDDWGEESQAPGDADYGQLEATDLTEGDDVQHDIFGKGTVLSLSGMGSSSKAKVRFLKGGTKTLLLSMARLKKL
jgi:DNA helicase-2/ATP-dependent DNA helicase PcrA